MSDTEQIEMVPLPPKLERQFGYNKKELWVCTHDHWSIQHEDVLKEKCDECGLFKYFTLETICVHCAQQLFSCECMYDGYCDCMCCDCESEDSNMLQ